MSGEIKSLDDIIASIRPPSIEKTPDELMPEHKQEPLKGGKGKKTKVILFHLCFIDIISQYLLSGCS